MERVVNNIREHEPTYRWSCCHDLDLDCFSDYSRSDILATYFACRATSNEDTILSTVGMPAHSFQLTLNPLPPLSSSFSSRGRHHIRASARLTEIEKFYSLRDFAPRGSNIIYQSASYCQLVQISAYHESPSPTSQCVTACFGCFRSFPMS